MKSITCSLLLALSVGHCFAQAFTLNRGGTTAKNYYVEIPYEVLNGKLFVQVGVAGKTRKFLFDTGAPVCIGKDLADQMECPVLHKDTLTDAYGNKDSVVLVGVSNIRLGELVFDDIPSIKGIPNFYTCWGVEGIIGSNLLRNSIVYINPAGHVIVLTDQIGKIPVDQNKSIPLITDIGPQSDPKIRIQFPGNSDAMMQFDTGDGNFMRLPEDFMHQMKRTGVYSVVNKGYGANNIGMAGAEKNADKYMLKFPSVSIAGALFGNVVVMTDKKTNSAIGSRLLDYGAVTLDYLHGRFYFNATNASNELSEKQWPLQPMIRGDQLVVGVVWGSGPGRIRPGQQILAIDDKTCEHVDICDILAGKLVLKGKESATITIKDEHGEVRKIQISKE